MINILFISNTLSAKDYESILQKYDINLNPSQYYFEPLMRSLSNQAGIKINMFSYRQFSTNSKIKIFPCKTQKLDNIIFHYPFVLNIHFIKYLLFSVSTFIYFFSWSLKAFFSKKILIIDEAVLPFNIITIIFAKFIKVKTSRFILDFNSLINESKFKKYNFFYDFFFKIINKVNYEGVIVVNKNMLRFLNYGNYLIMDSVFDNSCLIETVSIRETSRKNIIIYSGGLFRKYGIKEIIDLFLRSNYKDSYQLHFYGYGDDIQYIKEVSAKHPNVLYKGFIPKTKLISVLAQAKILLLIRDPKDKFTRFSFPSKLVDYLISGTPIIMNRLSGLNPIYYKFLSSFSYDEIINFRIDIISNIINNYSLAIEKAIAGKNHAENNLNSLSQAKRLRKFINKI